MKNLAKWTVVLSILIFLIGLFGAEKIIGAEEKVSVEIFNEIFGSYSESNRADTASLVGSWLDLFEDPEVIQKLTKASESAELEKEMEEIMEGAGLEPIMESILLSVIQKPGIQQTLMSLQTEQKIARRIETGMQSMNVALVTTMMKNIGGSDELVNSLVKVENLINTESIFSQVRDKLEKDPLMIRAMNRLDERELSAEIASLRISLKMNLDQEMGKFKNLIMELMGNKETVTAINKYFMSLLSDPENRAAVQKFVRKFFGSPETKPIWVDAFATAIRNPYNTEVKCKRYTEKLFQVHFVREGIEAAFIYVLKDQNYWELINDIMDEYMTEGKGYDFFRDFLIRCFDVAASGG